VNEKKGWEKNNRDGNRNQKKKWNLKKKGEIKIAGNMHRKRYYQQVGD